MFNTESLEKAICLLSNSIEDGDTIIYFGGKYYKNDEIYDILNRDDD